MRHRVMQVIAWAVIQLAVFTFRAPALLEGRLIDPDDYMRLVRVEQLAATGDWYDGRIERSNAPYGDTLHWTRPMDVLLLVGAWALTPFLGFHDGLFWAGALASPLLHLVLLLSIPWVAGPVLDQRGRRLAVLAVLAQPVIVAYALPGRADHHMLLLCAFALALGLILRVVTGAGGDRTALLAGVAAGFGVWLSVEFLLPLAASLGALALLWIHRGARWTRAAALFAAGLAGAVAIALAIERPPGDWLTIEYDRISVVHLGLALVALAFWGVVAFSERRGPGSLWGRAVLALAGAVVAAAAMRGLFPRFFAGPNASVDPRIIPIWYGHIEEVQPLLLPVDLAGAGRFLAGLGATLVAVPFLVRVMARERDDPRWPAWVYFATALLVLLPAALAMARFATYPEVVLGIVLVAWLGRMLTRVEAARWGRWRVPARAGLTAGALVGFMGLGWVVQAAAGSAPVAPAMAAAPARCDVKALSRVLSDPDGLGGESMTILAFLDYGSELLYRTPHRVVAAPYQRNGAGIYDTYTILTTTDDSTARAGIEKRAVDWILVCPGGDEAGFFHSNGAGGAFYRRLTVGPLPRWVEPVPLPKGLAYRLYRPSR